MKSEPVYLRNIPREAVEELDRLWPLVSPSGHLEVHKHADDWVHCEARVIRKRKDRDK